MDESPIFIACPTGDGRLDSGTARALFANSSRRRPVIPVPFQCGALTHNFNILLCHALNARQEEGIRYFSMIHADVEPEPFWLDTLIDEAEAHDADLMSAVIAIKDHRGLTTTAIGDPDNPWSPWCRLTLSQIWHEDFPETFDANAALRALAGLPGDMRVVAPDGANLEVNVGCMVYRIDRGCVIPFEVRNRIVLKNGQWEPEFQSDDWIFSRRVAAEGGRVFATRKVKITHRGGGNYLNDHAWGQTSDKDCARVRSEARAIQLIDDPAFLKAAVLT